MVARSAFLKVFGNDPILKVLDFLIVNEEFDQSMTTIAQEAEVGYATLKLFWPRLIKEKIVVQTRSVGRAKMYILNGKNPAVKKFKDFYWEITKQQVRRRIGKPVRGRGIALINR